MNCPECQELLQRRLDGEPLLDCAELQQHLAACSECRERHAAVARLEEGLRLLPRPTPPAELAQRTAEQVLRDRRVRIRRRVWVGVAIAASVLLVALTGYLGLWPWGQPQQVVIAPPEKKEPPEPEGPTIREGAQEAREALAALVDRFADRVREQGGLFDVAAPIQYVSTDQLPQVNLLTQPLGSTTQGLRQTNEGISAGARTVGNSARRAFSYFLRKMPPVQTQK
ncbi:MAG: zf-HC2 domain-containing protein [Gemmataceae bacterium]|nr:zf-HC2 domain-containing protein [Gemmataceae bacterium]